MYNQIEYEILNEVYNILYNDKNIPIRIKKQKSKFITNLEDKCLTIVCNNQKFKYNLEIKKNITKSTIGLLLQQSKTKPLPIILLSVYINQFIADRLRENKIEFVDCSGNMYINKKGCYIFVKGNKRNKNFKNSNNEYTIHPTGLKLIYLLLCNYDIVNNTYREIAKKANIALGSVGKIIEDLKIKGYVISSVRKEKQLIQKEKLFRLFIEEYTKRLKHKLLIGTYSSFKNKTQKMKIDSKYALSGGETAAEKLTNYLKSEEIIIYIKPKYLNNFLTTNRFKKNDNGNIKLYEYFWTDESINYKDCVNPILVYADLIATADKRNVETARMIYEKYIKKHFR